MKASDAVGYPETHSSCRLINSPAACLTPLLPVLYQANDRPAPPNKPLPPDPALTPPSKVTPPEQLKTQLSFVFMLFGRLHLNV